MLSALFHCLALSLAGTGWALAGSSSERVSPWWARGDLEFSHVDENYSWIHRRTGITDYWKPALGIWSHFRPDGLAKCPSVPWTSGRMCKSLRQLNSSAFELLSVYEPAAMGLWFRGLLDPNKPNRPDGLLQHGYTFLQTPYRMNPMPGGVDIPSHSDYSAPPGADTSRATILQPNSATFSGPRWLPPREIARSCRINKYCEMWLAESMDGTEPEDRKMGLFLEYDRETGELVQLFRMAELALKDIDKAFEPNPSAEKTFDLAAMEQSLSKLPPSNLETVAAKAMIGGDSIERVVEVGGWGLSHARVVKQNALDGPEVAFELDTTDGHSLDDGIDWWNPSNANSKDGDSFYWNCRFKDGAYARVPKVIDPELDDICFEFGCLLTNQRGLHRLLATGSRREGALNTLVYERWEPPKS